MKADIASAKLKLLVVLSLELIITTELYRSYLEFPLLAPNGVERHALLTSGLP